MGTKLTARRYIDEDPFMENKSPELILRQHNARPHFVRIMQNFFNIHNIDVMD